MKKHMIKATNKEGQTLYFQIMAGTKYLLTSIEYFAFTTFNRQMLEGRIDEMKAQYPDHNFELCTEI